MSQTKRGSFIEALTNTAIGYLINYTANLLIFPLFGMHISATANILLGLIYTAISIVRGYVLRRFFNRFTGSARKSRAAGLKIHVYSGMANGVISPEQATKILDESRARNEARP
ncbi:hypothetical protein ABXK61_16195 [Burkholderia sola]|uniref:DUF7220 family protein n=1 Tax=Burkholderia TaxID=32008 RepID=UPI001AE5B03A|nr:hypothetical protein [Burkholderia sp. AcTa6-5]MBP0714847.1 hypothetical protein [Burkholderia sp. AcTa6-5]